MKNIYLDSNENLYNPYNCLKNEFINEFLNINFSKYPDNIYNDLREGYAKYVGLETYNIMSGNGSDEMLNLIISTYIGKGDILLTFAPDFSMYDYYVNQNEGVIKKYAVNPEKFIVEDFITFIEEVNPKIVMFSNPNNPTGMGIAAKEIEKILIRFKDIKIVVDEAYYEFFKESVIDKINVYKNLIVTRTLSKAFGLASLRVGFLISNIDEIKKLLDVKVPYNVNSISQVLATRALKDTSLMQNSVEKIIKLRGELFIELEKINIDGIKFVKSRANYIYAYGESALKIEKILNKVGIIMRKFDDTRIRITIGTDKHNELILNVLRSEFKDEKSTD
ncbi:histidinol-phosphate transaminase [uncultured Clostridium sp.]|uniref:pyridoxal phosphate-dependent aminotransferase n=1 Tax=uncultured Clostridium sp. TaxID=59620 RepID=UPI002628BE85|nr:histidinol-phosphate transaminase [uncultured Clostridium sp.]